jgi:hypothetical protein
MLLSRRNPAGALSHLVLVLALATSALPGYAWTRGSGHPASETRQVAEFQAISVDGGIDVVARQGSKTSVQVQADDNLLPLLETVVESGRHGPTLKLRWKHDENISTHSKVLVTVVTPRLEAVASSGSGDVVIDSFTTPALDLALSGSGDARLTKLNTEALELQIAGSGDVRGSGKATRLKISIAGSGDVALTELQADDVVVHIAGSGDAEVDAEKRLEVHIAGSGDVSYHGHPALKSSVAGSGSVSQK